MATTVDKSSPLQNPLHFPSSAIKIPNVAASTTVESGLDGLDHPSLVVVSFYRFADFPDHASMRKPLKGLCEEVVSDDIPIYLLCLIMHYIFLVGKIKKWDV
jgi:hypothetical protein